MGVAEEAGKVASGVVEGLKTQPLMLACALLNLLLVSLIFYIAHASTLTREREVRLIYEHQERIENLLLKCSVGEK